LRALRRTAEKGILVMKFVTWVIALLARFLSRNKKSDSKMDNIPKDNYPMF
jgi:hypothetical protein